MDEKQYAQRALKAAQKSPLAKNCVFAFLIGGAICTLGEALFTLYAHLGVSQKDCAAWVSVTLIALTALLTGLGVFDKLAKHAGAGTMVPITGFANSVAAPAVEYQTEGRLRQDIFLFYLLYLQSCLQN